MAETKHYQVTDGPLSIRDTANGNRTGVSLAQGSEIRVTGEVVSAGGYLWVNHKRGWSALGKADGSASYMVDITDRDPDALRRFRVSTNALSVRTSPNGSRTEDKIYKNDVIEAIPTSRTVVGGYVWWQHDKGWSAERTPTGSQIYLEEIFGDVDSTTGTESSTGTTSQSTQQAVVQVPEGEQKRFQVIDGPLSIRDGADGNRKSGSLAQGSEITTYGDPVTASGYLWVQHDKGWSSLGTEDETEMYMLDITDRDPDAPRYFRVWSSVISVRDAANGGRLPDKLYRGTEIEVAPQSRTETGGYIWWQHDKGWSAERNTAGNVIYLKELFDTPDSIPIPEDQKAKIPDSWTGTKALQVANGVKVRGEPSTDPRGLVIRTIPRGEVLQCDMSTLTEADNYYWVRHSLGWSAIQSVNGKTVFLAEPGSIPGLIAIGADGPAAEDLPGYRSLFSRFPVALEDTQWFQYFGNNMFAMRNGKNYGYDRYSQGMHGGLDFGNSIKPKPIVAGLDAEYVKTEYPSANNTRIFLKKDDYTIIYQHITNAHAYQPGDVLTPDSPIGTIEHHSINNGWDHLHFEIRFMKNWIINPLLLFTEEMYTELTGQFDPDKPNSSYKKDFPKSTNNFFYHTATWDKWVTPLDQPMIKLAGPVIGPRGELEKSEL